MKVHVHVHVHVLMEYRCLTMTLDKVESRGKKKNEMKPNEM